MPPDTEKGKALADANPLFALVMSFIDLGDDEMRCHCQRTTAVNAGTSVFTPMASAAISKLLSKLGGPIGRLMGLAGKNAAQNMAKGLSHDAAALRSNMLKGNQHLGNSVDRFANAARNDFTPHHLISGSRAQKHPVMQAAAALGYDINNANNGLMLPNREFLKKHGKNAANEMQKVCRPMHTGSHLDDYYKEVDGYLDLIQKEMDKAESSGTPFTPADLMARIHAVEDALRRRLLDKKDPLKLQSSCLFK